MEDSSRLGKGGVYTSPHHNIYGREVVRGMAGFLPALSSSWGLNTVTSDLRQELCC